MQHQVPTIQTFQKTVEVPPSQYLDRVTDRVPVVVQRQSSMIHKVARTAEIPLVPFTDRIDDVLDMKESQVPKQSLTAKSSDTQVQFLDEVVDTPFLLYSQGAESRTQTISTLATVFNVIETQRHILQQVEAHINSSDTRLEQET